METITNYYRLPIPKVLHFILNTDCNAWNLSPVKDSLGVCGYCYRGKEKVLTTIVKIKKLLDMVHEESDITRIVFTGGDSLMPQNYIEFSTQYAKELGFTVNIHTNGLLLLEKYQKIKQWVDVYTLAIDGSFEKTADWTRGRGYFKCFNKNMRIMIHDNRTVAFNTFISPNNFYHLNDIAKMISLFAKQLKVEYWLISQYRPTLRDTLKKREIYSFSPLDFKNSLEEIVNYFPELNIFSQPTREDNIYPFRFCLLADGNMTTDIGKSNINKNIVIGNCFDSGFISLYDKAFKLWEKK